MSAAHRLGLALAALGSGCESFQLAPIDLDVSSNCNLVEFVVAAPGVQSPARPWHTVVAAAADRGGLAASWLLVVRDVGGIDQLALLHVDDELGTDHDIVIDAAPGLAGQFELVTGLAPGSVFLTQRAPGTFYIRQYDPYQVLPLVAASPNLATIAAPCQLDADGLFQSCDASEWFQDLVFFEDQPFALTFAPSSATFATEFTPTALDMFLSPTFPLDPNRTIVFAPSCSEQELEPEDLEVCEALAAERSYPEIASAGLARDRSLGLASLGLYREVQQGDEPFTVAEAPLVLLGIGMLGRPTGTLRIATNLPAPRPGPPSGVAVDPNASYFQYTAADGSPVLARASHAPAELERLDEQFEFPEGSTLLQLDDDVALHRVVDSQWEILKLFPDAPARSQVTRFTSDAAIESVTPAGLSTFLVHRDDGVADLVHVRCAIAPAP